VVSQTEGPLMSNKAETAGQLAVTRVPMALATDNVSVVRQRLRVPGYDVIDLIFVLDNDGRYQGVAELRAVLEARDEQPIASLISRSWPSVTPDTDQEHASHCASAAALAFLPVVDQDKRAIGVIPPLALIKVLAQEHHYDVNRLVGILRGRADAIHALHDPPLHRVAHRLPWLLIGLAMSTWATAIMASYEETLQANILVAFFIPALVYITDAIGTQTEAIAVRGLSLRHRPLKDILGSEIVTGALIGLALGVPAVLAIWAAFGSLTVGLGVGISLFFAGTLASGLGLFLPWLLSRLGIDPAFGSGPVATIVQDTLTILIYFIVMTNLFQT
jgi:magnesium transporter